MRVVVLKLGSAFFENPGKETIEKIKEFFKDKEGVIVAGGGPYAKKMIKAFREKGFSNGLQHYIGIEMSHLNAKILAKLIGGIYCRSLEEISNSIAMGKIAVTGGALPGQSTDAVAAEIAVFVDADLLILVKDTGAIYTKDPKKHADAKKIKKISFDDIYKILEKETRPGHFGVIDPIAAEVIKNHKIHTIVCGPDLRLEEGTEIS